MNNSYGKLYVKKRTTPAWLSLYIAIFPLIMAFLIDFLRLPSFIKYTVDAAIIVILAIGILQKQMLLKKQLTPFVIFICSFILYTLITYLFNFQSPFYYLWGLRNNFRFYIAFAAFILFLDKDDASGYLKFLDILFWINIIIELYQYAALGYAHDFLGGIFGVQTGCNAYSLIFYLIVVGKSVLSFMNGKEKAWLCITKCAVSLVLAAMAEVKIYFLFFILTIIVAAFITKFSWKKFWLMLVAIVFIVLSDALLVTLFGDSSSINFDRVLELMVTDKYSSGKDLGRLTAIPTISETILRTVPDKLFGMGLGNCDTSSFAICNTPFFQDHNELHYSWFSSAFLFLETGALGLMLNLSFYIICFICAWKRKKDNLANELYCQLSMITSIVCFILVFYNSSLRMEVAYLSYFILALPFIDNNFKKKRQRI